MTETPLADRLASGSRVSLLLRIKRKLWTLLELCRFPAVFTALADPLLGSFVGAVAISEGGYNWTDLVFSEEGWRHVVMVGAPSFGAYLFGMVLNDLADRKRDAVIHPDRPLPTRRVHVATAVALAIGFALLALVASFFTTTGYAGIPLGMASPTILFQTTLVAASALLVLIVAYTFCKRLGGPIGVAVAAALMGSCRGLNVWLGASLAWSSNQFYIDPDRLDVPDPADPLAIICIAVGLAVYVAGVTVFASAETTVGKLSPLIAGLVVAAFGLVTLIAASLLLGTKASLDATAMERFAKPIAALMFGAIALRIGVVVIAALRQPKPQTIGPAVGVMIRSIIPIDAAAAYCMTGSIAVAAMILSLIIPAILLRRIAIT